MSHLPLDARAILEYLNELGYRNITAAQLKEFMKGMQPHSEVPSATTTTTKPSTPARHSITSNSKTTANNNNINVVKSPNFCKLVKGKRPLINFYFYLDIKDHQISKKVEERISELGGTLEFFLTKSVTHFITDRSTAATAGGQQNNNNNQNGYCVNNSPANGAGAVVSSGGGVGGGGSGVVGVGVGYPITPSPYIQSPQTPATPKTPYTNRTHSGDSGTDGIVAAHSRLGGGVTTTPNHKKKISRADAMLHRALQSNQQPTQQSANQQALTFSTLAPAEEEKRVNLEQGTYAIWHLDYAIRFLKKVTADLKQYAKKSQQPTKGACEPILLKGHFIKIESIKRHSRPYYSVFRKLDWPKIHFKEDGAFRLIPKEDELKSAKDKPSKTNAMTRKSRSSSKHNHNHMRLKAKQAPKQTEKPAAIDNSSEKQCGVCEICKIEYDTLTIHLKTKDHEFFAQNQSNYLALDSLIKTSANVDKFLDENTKIDSKKEPIETMEVDEEVTRQTRQSSRIQTPPPPLKVKTKLRDIDSPVIVAEKKPNHNNVRKPAKLLVPLESPPIRHPLPTSTIYKVVEDNKARTEPATPKTSSIIVKFKKVRATELSVLNGEAENFMFPKRPASSECATDSDRQTSTDSNRISSSSISSESHSISEPIIARESQEDSAAAKRRRVTTISTERPRNAFTTALTTMVASGSYQSFPNTPIQPNRTPRITREFRETSSRHSVTPKPTTQRRRHCVGGGRRRRGTSRNRRQKERARRQRCASEDRMGDEENLHEENEEEQSHEKPNKKKKKKEVVDTKPSPPAFDISQSRINEQKYAFERLPVRELWFEVFHRQDACQERLFEYWGSTSYRKLPYEMGAIPIRTLPSCKLCTPVPVKKEPKVTATVTTPKRIEKLKKIKKEKPEKPNSKTPDPDKASRSQPRSQPRIRNKLLNKATFLSYDLMPRKSPREHASTLAILSCLIKQRQDSEPDEPPVPPIKEEIPEKVVISRRKTPTPVISSPRTNTPEPLQFVSEISENVKRLRRGQRKYEDFIPTKPASSPINKCKPKKPKTGLEFELDEKRLKSLDAKQKSSVQLEHEIDAYLGRITVKTLRLTPTPPPTDSSGFIDGFSSDVNLIDLIDCYDGGGGQPSAAAGVQQDGDADYSNDQPVYKPASNCVFNLFSAHNRRRKNNKVNRTGWPKKRRNAASTRQNHLLQKRDRFRLYCDYQTRHKNRMVDGSGLGATSMTPPETDLDDCTRSPVPSGEIVGAVAPTPVPGDGAILCKEEILNNGYMSPSEKADNSDIFTVSSDGLDTDLDVSSSQIKTEDIDDECTTLSTIAAPPATPEPPAKNQTSSPHLTLTANNKMLPLAITSIMKKEVKVSCKRLRTPFRRFRQRR